ncbi:hypothetical protein [Amycolatopsis sp. GM8]|uniref:hypothetical protein n=1 Tax=Amycolatopsis sp. GM8 TaxID=2896530 RepID=UPI001F342466|nr:hypothetical protein [Amycolatopsis sp. GM8]
MSRESGQDRSQKTVAELLALHGGNTEGRRRHRRAADDEDEQQPNGNEPPRRGGGHATETGPQAIIDRVRGDNPPPPNGRRNGGRRALPEDDAPPAPPLPPRPPQDSAAMPRPNGAPPQPPSGAFPRPVPPPPSGTFPKPNVAPPESGTFPRPPQESGTYPRPQAPESGGFPRPAAPPPPESGAFPLPSRRRPPNDSGPLRRPPQESAPMPLPEPQDERRPPVRPAEETRQVPPLRRPQPGALSARLDGLDAPAPEDVADPGPPPGGMPSGAFQAPPRRPLRRGRPPAEPEPHTEQFQAVNGKQPPEAVVPPDAPPAGLSRWRRQRPQPSAAEETEIGARPVHPSGFNRAVPDEQMEATGFHDPFADDDAEVDEFGDFGEAEPERLGTGYDYEDEAGQPVEYEEDEEPEAAEASPAKQWLSMAAQLALGVIGGAAVWLGFNWLWGKIPAAALIVALVVIVGLVFIVRKIRRADDIQTMVLAVLVGLVVTVSPAALLLLSR